MVEQLLQNICLLLASRTRDVVKAALGFLKVTLLLVDTKLLAKHVQAMVRPCVGRPEEGGGAELGLPWAAGGISRCTLLLPRSQGHNLDLSVREGSEEFPLLNAGMDLPEKPHEPALPSGETSPRPCLGRVWGDSSRVSKVVVQGKGGRLGAQGRGALVSRVSLLSAGGRGEPFGRHETPLPYEAAKPLHQVHPQVWVSQGLLGHAGAALGQRGSSLGSCAGGGGH